MSTRRWVAVIGILVVTATACGTRLEDDAFVHGGSAVEVRAGEGGGPTAGSGEPGEGTAVGPGSSEGVTGVDGADDSGPVSGGGAAGGGATGAGPTGGDDGTEGGPTGGGGGGGGDGGDDGTVGVTRESITVGNITAIEGPLGPTTFTPPLRGARAFFQWANDNGGIAGRQVRFITCDDRENPDRNKECARKLVENDEVFAFVANSTDTYQAGEYISSKGVPDIGFPIGNAYYKYPTLFAIYGSPGYPRDGEAVGHDGTLYIQSGQYRWFRDNLDIERAAVLYYNIPISRTAGQFIKEGLEREGIEVVYEPNQGAGRDPANPSWDSEVVAMRQAGAEAVWHAIDISGFQKLCQSMDKFQYQVEAAVATVNGVGQLVGDFSAPCRDSVYGTGFSVPYSDTDHPEIARIHEAIERYEPDQPMHQWVVDGWMAAKVFADAVEVQGDDLTRQGVIEWLSSKTDGSYTAGGLSAPKNLWWPRGGIDYSEEIEDCVSVMKWDSDAGSFVRQTDDRFYCFVDDWYSYEPVDDGS